MHKAGDWCKDCPAYGWDGYVPPEGFPHNGVVLVGEAPGEEEAKVGRPFVGRSGMWLTQTLQRGGFNRDDFGVMNVLRSRPPGNVIPTDIGPAAIARCGHLFQQQLDVWKPKVLVALGNTAMERLLGFSGVEKLRGYVFESPYGWVVPTYHPAYILRGKFNLTNVWLWDIGRAVTIAQKGYQYGKRQQFLLDPALPEFEGWIDRYFRAVAEDPSMALAVDIETPTKGDDEGELEVDDPSYIILRVGFGYKDEAVSIPWEPVYMAGVRKLLVEAPTLLAHNAIYDVPRLRAAGIAVGGNLHDTMVGWHILNSDLPKGLGYVAPFAAWDQPAWKHLSHEAPAYYNATDCYVTVKVWEMVQAGLRKTKQWEIYDRDVLQLDPILSRMSVAGMPINAEARRTSAEQLDGLITEIDSRIQAKVPESLFPLQPKQGYTRTPKDTTGLVQQEFVVKCKVCQSCGEIVTATKAHTKRYKKKVNPCADAAITVEARPVTRWVKVLEFTPSTKQLLEYGKHFAHPVYLDKKKDGRKTPTTNEKALKKLLEKTGDSFYQDVLDRRELDKLASTYVGRPDATNSLLVVGGVPVGRDGRVHTTFRHDPSTLRLSSAAPNMQNWPRVGKGDTVQRLAKGMFHAPPGYSFYGVDFSGIEALLVFWLAQSPRGIRLAQYGVHDYFVSHLIGEPADLSWSDADLKGYLHEMKDREKKNGNLIRDPAKRTIHAAHYLVTGHKLWLEYPDLYPDSKKAQWYIDFYMDLMPEVPRWHRQTLERADKQGYIRAADGFVMRFFRVFEWTKRNGEWVRKEGETAKAAIACEPQHLASTIMKESLRDLDKDRYIRDTLRLTIHDEIFGEVPTVMVENTVREVQRVMEKPRSYLPLDPSWGFGTHLAVGTEAKVGTIWSEM